MIWTVFQSSDLHISKSPNLLARKSFLFVNMYVIALHLIQSALITDSGLCLSRLLWERSALYWDLLLALSLRAAACRDCRGLLPLLRNAVCVLLVQPLGGLRVQPAGNCSTEVTVNKSPALTSVSCTCFQIRGLVSRSNASGFYSLPLIFQSETSDLVHPAQDPKICLQSLVSVIFCSSELLFWLFTKVICIIHC